MRAGYWGWGLAALLWLGCGGAPEEALTEPDVAQAPPPGELTQAVHTSRLAPRWARTSGELTFHQVGSDTGGNVYVALQYRGAVRLAGVALPWNGDAEDYHSGVAKFRSDGTLVWARGWGPASTSPNIDYANVTAFTVTPGGTVYVGGDAQQGGVLIGGQRLGSGTYLLRLGSDGTLRWARSTRPEPRTDFNFLSFAAHPGGGFYALASFRRFSESISPRLMLIRYRSDGVATWGNIYEQSTGGTVTPMRVAADEDGNAYVSGYVFGTASFGGPTGGGDMVPFVFSTRSSGSHRWTRFIDLAGVRGYADGLAVGGGRVVVAVGSAPRSQLLGLTTGSGTLRWRRALGDVGNGMTVDTAARDEVVLSVASGDAAALGVPRTPTQGNVWNTTAFVARFRRSDGLFVRARNFEVRVDNEGNSVFADSCTVTNGGNVFVAGTFDGTVDFGTGPRSGNAQSFLVRYGP